jgi:ribosome-associated protein
MTTPNTAASTNTAKTQRHPISEQLRAIAIEALEDMKAVDLNVYDISKFSDFTDFTMICTGRSNRHVKSLANSVAVKAKENGFKPLSVEGAQSSEWVLVDLGDVVVHVMQAETRDFYRIEELWVE